METQNEYLMFIIQFTSQANSAEIVKHQTNPGIFSYILNFNIYSQNTVPDKFISMILRTFDNETIIYMLLRRLIVDHL